MVTLTFTGDFETPCQSFVQDLQIADTAGLFTDRFRFSTPHPGNTLADPTFSFSAVFKGTFSPDSGTGTITGLEANYNRTQLGSGTTKPWSFEIEGLTIDLRQANFISVSSCTFSGIGLKLALTSQIVAFSGTAQNDLLTPNSGFAMNGADTLNGGDGRDTLNGRVRNDRVDDGTGNGILNGGADRDTLTKGIGADVFALVSSGGSDTVNDVGPDDGIGVTRLEYLANITAQVAGDDLILQWHQGILLQRGSAHIRNIQNQSMVL